MLIARISVTRQRAIEREKLMPLPYRTHLTSALKGHPFEIERFSKPKTPRGVPWARFCFNTLPTAQVCCLTQKCRSDVSDCFESNRCNEAESGSRANPRR